MCMTEERFSAWLDAYGEAFERQDPDAAAGLFTPNATYQWGPFGELLRGPQEIRDKWAKWAEASDSQATRLRFEYEVIAVTDEVGIARWIASCSGFDTVTRYEGIFEVKLAAADLCSEFREWWNTTEEPLTVKGDASGDGSPKPG